MAGTFVRPEAVTNAVRHSGATRCEITVEGAGEQVRLRVADIATGLHLSESTVRDRLSAAIGKTGTRNRMEAVREARRQGWL